MTKSNDDCINIQGGFSDAQTWPCDTTGFRFTSSGCFFFNETPSPEELEQQFDNAAPFQLVANYDPINAVLPYPSNIVFSGTTDGTINIPVDDPNDYAVPQVVLNTLDGFSTMQPMTLTFNGVVDETTIRAGDTVRVFEVELLASFSTQRRSFVSWKLPMPYLPEWVSIRPVFIARSMLAQTAKQEPQMTLFTTAS